MGIKHKIDKIYGNAKKINLLENNLHYSEADFWAEIAFQNIIILFSKKFYTLHLFVSKSKKY